MKIVPALKLADSHARHNAEMYRQLFEKSMDAVLQTMPDGTILAANPAACVLFALTEQEIIQRGRAGLVDPSDPRTAELLGLREKTGSATGELRMCRGDGSLFDAELSSSSYLNQHGDKLASILIRDFTQRKRTQEALAASEAHLHNLMLNLGVGIVVHGPDTMILHCNKTALTLLGFTQAQVLGKVAQDQAWHFVRENGTPMSIDEYPVMRVVATGDPVHDLVLGIFHPLTDDYAWVIINAFPELTSDGQLRQVVVTFVDITARRQSEVALKQSAQLLEASQSIAKLGGWELDLRTQNLFWTAETYRIHETSPTEFVPTVDAGVGYFLPESRCVITDALQAAMERGEGYDLELKTLTTKGRVIDVRCTCEVTLQDGRPIKLTGIFQDITDRKQAESALITAKQAIEYTRDRLLLATDSGGFGVWDYDLTDGSLLWDLWMYRLFGLEPSDTAGTYELWSSHLHPEDKSAAEAALQEVINNVRPFDTEFRIVWRDGSVHHLRATARVTRDAQGKAVRVTGVNWDITDLKAHQKQLEQIAHYDALTKLPNRVLLADRLQQAMAHCQRRGQTLAVAYLDIDGFKAINDRHGHTAGDQFLIDVALLMKGALREGDTLARLGGDEFVAILADLDHVQDCEPVLQRLLEAASTEISLSEGIQRVSASIGVTLFPQDNVDADQLLRHADQAMYVAKGEGKNRYRMFDVEQDSASKRHRESLESIRSAIDNNEFVLYYQPKVNVKTGTVVGTEALIRWQHPQRGLLAPGLFLPLIEGQAISVELGEWVIDNALQQISTWRAAGLDMAVSVNVGARQLQGSEFFAKLTKALAAHPDMRSGQLELEIVETSALEDVTQVSTLMRACLALGVGFALDDFGTGYSSLNYLKRLPAGLLKIDQGFVRDMLIDQDDLAIVQGVIGLARVFKREVIAEGVETEAHARKLLELGCELAQGYGVARPMPAADLRAWVESWHAKAVWTA